MTRLLCTGEYLVSSSMDNTVRAWHIDDEVLDEISEREACIGIFEVSPAVVTLSSSAVGAVAW